MRYAVYLPLLVSVVLAPPLVTAGLRRLPDRLTPRVALRLLIAVLVSLAVASTASLVLLVVGGVSAWWSGPVLTGRGHADPGGLVAGVLAALVLAVAVARLARTHRRTARRRLLVHRTLAGPTGGAPWVVDDDAVYALAAPGVADRDGRVVLSRGLLEVLDDAERDAVVAHEREHLEGRHHRYLVVGEVTLALNPALTPLRRDLGYALERCADEAAARRLDDRALVARAIGRVALAARRAPAATRTVEQSLGLDAALMLGALGGPVPRRVEALLVESAGESAVRLAVRRLPVVLVGAAALLLAGFAVLGAGHAAVDLADILTAR